MIRSFRLIGAAGIALAVLALGGAPTAAADGRVPLPTLATPKGDACVAPIDVMRRDHPDLLKAQRDDTMKRGIRDGKFSLTGCIDCHAAPDPKAPDPAVRSIEPFCESCHTYAAVKLDCWSCHNPKADETAGKTALQAPAGTDHDALLAELKAHLSRKEAAR